jgi:hypothetical protein
MKTDSKYKSRFLSSITFKNNQGLFFPPSFVPIIVDEKRPVKLINVHMVKNSYGLMPSLILYSSIN